MYSHAKRREYRAVGSVFFQAEVGVRVFCLSRGLGDMYERQSGWFSGTLLGNSVETELERIKPQLELFAALSAPVIVYGETWQTVQNRQDQPLNNKPVLADSDFPAYGERLTEVAEYCKSQGVPMAYHHHMGTGVETERELDMAMNNTGDSVGLLLDTGHLLFAGGDILRVLENHGHRINPFHAKAIRAVSYTLLQPN